MSFFKSKPIQIVKKQSEFKSQSYSPPTKHLAPPLLSNSYTPPQILKKSNNVEVSIVTVQGEKRVIKKTKWNETHKRCYIFNELDALQTIQSKYIPKLYGFHTSLDAQHVWMEIECIEGTDLHQWIKKSNPINKLDVMRELAEGLHEIHSYSFIHGDIKPENIMISSSNKITYIDFGFSSCINPLLPSGKYFRGSIPYMYPMMYLQKTKPDDYTPDLLKKNDIYGLANVFYFIMKGHPIHKILPHDNHRSYMERVLKCNTMINSGFPQLDVLLFQMTNGLVHTQAILDTILFLQQTGLNLDNSL
jgi:serine/threonine protein kinase